LNEVVREVEFWEQAYRDVEELERSGFKIAHGGLNRMLEEERHQ
jgi:virulence-associated protein VapD